MDCEIGEKERPVKLMPISPFFFNSNPLVKSEYLFAGPDLYSGKLVGLRPVYIIGDLEILHDWLKSDLRITNRSFNTSTSSLYRYYKYILTSTNAQSCTIEIDHIPFMQVDILPVKRKDWPDELRINDRDYALWFLTLDNFRQPDLIKNGFDCLLQCLYRLTDIHFLYVRLPVMDYGLKRILANLGFETVSYHTKRDYEGPVFRKRINVQGQPK